MNKCHFIGIGGSGMSGLARLVIGQKIAVSGSDIASSVVTDSLSEDGAQIFIGHSAHNIHPDMTVIYTTDIKKDNPEYQAAIQLKCPMLHRSELLQKLMEKSHSLAVAGTHGKTTTASLLAWTLASCGQTPAYAIGGIIPQLYCALSIPSNSGQGAGKYFVAEACESDGSFLNYAPYGAIVTNIDFDHMDYYRTEEALVDGFKNFMEKVHSKKYLFWCEDDPYLQKIKPGGIGYGFGKDCRLKASNFQQKGWMISIDISLDGKVYENVEVALTGKHNALNALAVFGLAISIGMEENAVRNGLRSFQGVLRRCEKKGEAHGILFLDDYAHHPTELKMTLTAIKRAIGERRLVAAYQPHRYTRAKDCMGMYQDVFGEADELFITEIYAAREVPIPGISHEPIVHQVRKELKNRCQHVDRAHLASKLAEFLRPHDVLVSLGAGDITQLCAEVMDKLALKAPPKLKLGLVFGGMSVEHEISLISSANIHVALNRKYYDIEQFGMTRQGRWLCGEQARNGLERGEEVYGQPKISGEVLSDLLKCDILFPILHGTCGEDGTIQGFFDLFSKAYVGCDHRSSAISMDKVLSKRLALEAGIATVPFVSFSRRQWETQQEELICQINRELVYPLFVKPVHLGSSIGIHKVSDAVSLAGAIEDSFRFDTRVVVENGIEKVREIEFSVIGNDEVEVFPPGEVYACGSVHDYDSKYGLNPDKAAAAYEAKAKLSDEQIAEGKALAKCVYQTIGCSGMARVDTFLDPCGKFWFNEINPIPGFTKYSLFPVMCEANGLPLGQLIDRLIVLGLHRRRQLDRLEV